MDGSCQMLAKTSLESPIRSWGTNGGGSVDARLADRGVRGAEVA